MSGSVQVVSAWLVQICLLKMEDLLRKGFTLGAAKKFMKQIQEWQ